MTPREAMGLKIARQRKHLRMSQEELAEKTGLARVNISRIENGRYSPGLDILAKIADALGCELDIAEKSPD